MPTSLTAVHISLTIAIVQSSCIHQNLTYLHFTLTYSRTFYDRNDRVCWQYLLASTMSSGSYFAVFRFGTDAEALALLHQKSLPIPGRCPCGQVPGDANI